VAFQKSPGIALRSQQVLDYIADLRVGFVNDKNSWNSNFREGGFNEKWGFFWDFRFISLQEHQSLSFSRVL